LEVIVAALRSPTRALSLATLSAVAVLVGACNLITGTSELDIGAGGAGAASATGTGTGGEATGMSGSTASAGGVQNGAGGMGGVGGVGGAQNGVGGAQNGASSSSASSSSASGGPTCSPPCGANQYCETATLSCVCNPGFVMQGGMCVAVAPGDPTTHTQQEVCDQWKQGHVVTEQSPLVASGAECDPGTLKPGAIADTLKRINMFRWMAGLGPTTDDATLNAGAQKCANLEAWWNFSGGGNPHSPPSSTKCYTAEGASIAGQSNIAWGSGNPAQAIDQFMQDNGNASTMGHRRWILNPPLNPVGVGYWQTGGQYGNSECLRVFGASGTGPNPSWVAMPPPGFVPTTVAQWTWTFHGSLSGIANAQISVLRVDDNTPLAVNVQTLQQGFAQNAISWTANGWQPQAGMTYRVTVSGLGGGDVVYDVKPVVCN